MVTTKRTWTVRVWDIRRFYELNLLLLIFPTFLNSYKFEDCNLPESWIGNWHSAHDKESWNISITSTTIEGKGECILRSGDHYIFTQKNNMNNKNCSSCLLIYDIRPNVLGYKEFSDLDCEHHKNYDPHGLKILCDNINLYTQFYFYRLDAEYEKCPFEIGKYSFSYERKSNTCDNPSSTASYCGDNSRFVINYEACIDDSSQSDWNIIQCMANWKEGRHKFIIGRVQYKNRNGYTFQCFTYKTIRNDMNIVVGYKVARSGEESESCTGLDIEKTEGDENLSLTKVQEKENCHFPYWLIHDWEILNNSSRRLHFNEKNDTLIESSDYSKYNHNYTLQAYFTCKEIIEQSEDHVSISGIYHILCNTYLTVITFYKKSYSVIQFEMNQINSSRIIANIILNRNETINIYIQPNKLKQNKINCPIYGKYTVSDITVAGRSVPTMCENGDYKGVLMLEEVKKQPNYLRMYCNNSELNLDVFNCYSNWTRHGITYFIASDFHNNPNMYRCFKIIKLLDADGSQIFQVESNTHYNCESGNVFKSYVDVSQNDSWKFILKLTDLFGRDNDIINFKQNFDISIGNKLRSDIYQWSFVIYLLWLIISMIQM